MKKILLSILFFVPFLSFTGADISFPDTVDKALLAAPKVDKRVELLSIIFRIAGNPEYNGEEYKGYVNDIHKHFDKYKDLPVISFAKELRDSNGVSYDAVMSLAIHLSQPPALKPLVAFSDSVPDARWGAANANKFVTLLQKFYVDAKCEEFFKEEESTYKLAEKAFKPVYDKLDLNWYKQYYGKMPDGKFDIVIGLGNGDGNFGVKVVFPGKNEEVYAVMGTWSVDSLGLPSYKINDYFPILVHEFNHSFVNFLIYKNKKMFEEAGVTIYNKVTSKMRMQAYGDWTTMICEALVRASVIKYLKSHDSVRGKQPEKETMEQLNSGFLWIRENVALLDKYEGNRRKYPTLESFIPEIAAFYKDVAKNIDTMQANYNRHCAHVVSIVEFKNNAADVNPGLTEIKFKIDKALNGKGYSISYGEKGKDFYPVMKKIGFSDDNTCIAIQVELMPEKEYEFILKGWSFKTPDGYPLEEFVVNFKTGK